VFSATQVGMAMEELAKAGLAPKEILGAIGPMLDLAASGGLDLAEAAMIASNAMNTFKLQATDLGHVADVLAVAAAKSATDVRNIGYAFGYVAPIASALNMPLEEVVTSIALMSKNGIDASMAGTSLRNILQDIISPTDKAQVVFDTYNIKVKDAHGQMLPLVDIIKQFEPVLAKGTKGVQDINTVFGARGGPGFIALVQQGAEEMTTFKTALENSNGAAREMAETRLNNLRGAIERVKGAMESFAITFYNGNDEKSVSGSIKKLLDGFIVPLIDGFENLISTANPIGSIFSFIVDSAMKAIDAYTGTVASLAFATEAYIDFFDGIGAAIKQAGKALWEPIKAPFEVMMGVIRQVFVDTINWWGEKITSAANTLFAPIRGALDKLGIHIGEFNWTPLTTEPAISMTQAWSAAVTNMETGLAGAKNTLTGTFTNLKNNSILIFDEMKNSFDGKIVTGMTLSTQEAVKAANAALNGKGGTPLPDTAEDVADNAVKKAAGKLYYGGVKIPEAFIPHMKKLKDMILEFPLSFKTALELSAAEIESADLGKKIAVSMWVGWNQYFESMPTLAKSIRDNTEVLARAMESTLADSFSTFIETGKFRMKDALNELGAAFAKGIGDLLSEQVMKQLVEPGVNALKGLFSGAFSDILDGLKGTMSSIGSSLGSLGSLGGIAGVGGAMAVGYGLVSLIDSFMPESKTIEEQIAAFKSKNNIVNDADVVRALTGYLSSPTLNQYGNYKNGELQIGLLKRIFDALGDTYQNELLNAGGNVTRWAKSLQAGAWNQTGAGSALITPKFHVGGFVPDEGWFLGLKGEGVLNRDAMGRIGTGGLQALNEGRGVGNTIVYVIQAWDAEDVERVLDRKIIPKLREKSEAGIEVIHEYGVKKAV